MPKIGSTRKRRMTDYSLPQLADEIRDLVLSPGSVNFNHLEDGALRGQLSSIIGKISGSKISDGSITESKLSYYLRAKIQNAKDAADQAVAHAAFKFQEQISDLEGAFAARVERAVALASTAIQPGARAFLHSIKTSTVEFGHTVITGDVAITSTESTFYNVATGSGNVTVTLPSAVTCKGLMLGFNKTLAANDMIIDGAGAQTINGSTTQTFGSQHDAIIIVSDGSNWNIFSNRS